MAKLEPFDPKKHKPISTVGNRYATEYLASENAPDNGAWNIPTIWFDTETKEPVFLSETKEEINKDGTVTKYFSNDKAWNAAFEYEKETGKKFPRFKDIPSAVEAAEKRSNKGGASEKKLTMNEGGTAMKNQMDMFADGGLKDDGTTKDPVSGNDVPSGSLAEEVRDDIPAQLSEGEYVIPADVVRFYGVKFFEDLRTDAKMGLANMERNGRIGGEPVAVAMITSSGEKELSPEEEDMIKKITGAAKGGYIGGYNVAGDVQSIETGIKNQAATALKTDPLQGFRYGNTSGITAAQTAASNLPNNNAIITYKTYADPVTRKTMQIPFTNGVVNPTFQKYIDEGYLPIEQLPAQNVVQTKKDRDPKPESEKIARNDLGGALITNKNYNALKTSFGRLEKVEGIDLNFTDYYNLPLSKKVALIPAEIKSATGKDVSADDINAIINDKDNPNALEGLASTLGFGLFGSALTIIKDVFEGIGSVFKALLNPSTAAEVSGAIALSSPPPLRPRTGGSGSSGFTDIQKASLSNVGNLSGKNIKEQSTALTTATKNVAPVSRLRIDDDKAPKGGGTKAGGADLDTALGISGINKGGLLTKPKRKPKKPRGKGLASK